MRWGVRALVIAVVVVGTAARARAQTPPLPPISMPPPSAANWALALSGGLALTSGNRDTSTVNFGYEFLYDPKTRIRLKSDAFYLRARSDGRISAERLGFNAREEYKLKEGAFVFGQVQFVRDRFKQISYIWAPTAGLGYRLVESETTTMSLDTGLGAVWEKNLERDVRPSVAITVAQKLMHRFSPNATITEGVTALYKTNDIYDSLYVFNAAVASSMTARTQLKVEIVDTYKNQVAQPTLVNNDVALIVALVYKR